MVNPMAAVDEESPHKFRSEQGLGEDCEVCAPTTVTVLMLKRLGLEDLCSSKVWRASMAELVGTAVLVFTLDAIAISSVESHVASPGVLAAALTSLSVTILLLAIFPISGGHLNPAITLAAALLGVVSVARAAVYVLAQCAGAILGALLLKAVLGDATAGQGFSIAGCTLGAARHGVDTGTALWLEAVCTFVLLFAVRVAFDQQHARALGAVAVCGVIGAAVGLMGFASAAVTGKQGYTGAGMNPAKCVGAAVARGGALWGHQWVFWVGPAMACGAFYVFAMVVPRQHFYPHGRDYDAAAAAVKLLCAGACGDKQQVQQQQQQHRRRQRQEV